MLEIFPSTDETLFDPASGEIAKDYTLDRNLKQLSLVGSDSQLEIIPDPNQSDLASEFILNTTLLPINKPEENNLAKPSQDLLTGQPLPTLVPTPTTVATLPSIGLNQSITGDLSSTDPLNPTRSGTYADDYLLTGVSPGQSLRVSLNSALDNYLQIINATTGEVIAYNDDANSTLNAELVFTVQSGINYLLRATSYLDGATGSYTINTSEVPTVSITASDATASERNTSQTANPGRFTFTRTGSIAAALTVNYTVGGTATNGSDYQPITENITFAAGQRSISLPINVIDDTEVESAETLNLTLETSSAYGMGTSNTAAVTITNNDFLPTISLTASDAAAAERNTGQTANPGRFTFTRTGSTAAALTVNYTIGGTATNGSDYQPITENITFAAGQRSVTLPINVINDTEAESPEMVNLTLATNTAYTVGTSNTAAVTIADNDVVLPTISITASDAAAAETNTGQTANPGQFTENMGLKPRPSRTAFYFPANRSATR